MYGVSLNGESRFRVSICMEVSMYEGEFVWM